MFHANRENHATWMIIFRVRSEVGGGPRPGEMRSYNLYMGEMRGVWTNNMGEARTAMRKLKIRNKSRYAWRGRARAIAECEAVSVCVESWRGKVFSLRWCGDAAYIVES
jgi:hypothetical protein